MTAVGARAHRLPARHRLAAGLLLLAVAACGGNGATAGGAAGAGGTATAGAAPSGDSGVDGEVVVLAAASLTESFSRIAEEVERRHPGLDVTLSFAASSALAQQVLAGAPADVFAAASPATMAQVTRGGAAAGEPAVFARNRLEIAVPAGNPGGVRTIADLGRDELTIALCAEQVPCGAAAVTALDAAGVTAAPDTLEQDVRAALTKVELGEVDAALVYRTDVIAAGDAVEGIPFPAAEQAVNDYLLVALAGGRHPAAARVFVDHVLSTPGRRVLADAGFAAP